MHEMFPGTAEIRKGYLYGSDKPGLGIDIGCEESYGSNRYAVAARTTRTG